MPFLNVFLKTLGFLIGVLFFFIILNLLVFVVPKNEKSFNYTKGDSGSENIIAILELNGPIISNLNRSLIGNIIEHINPNNIKKKLLELNESKPKIIVLKINSPGGTVAASAELEKIIKNFKKTNNATIYVYGNEILASGGYWIATTGDKIFANYGSIIGSIGVSGPSWYYYDNPTSISNGLFDQKIKTENGIKIFNQNAGDSKDLYNPFRMPSENELRHLQSIVEEIYDDFLIKVSSSRKIEINILKNDIGALIYSSKQAKQNYLIDDILSFDELIEKIVKEKEFDNFKIIEMKRNQSLISRYLAYFTFMNYEDVCNKLNSNFVTLIPIYLNKC